MRHCGGTMASCGGRSLAAQRGSMAALVFGEGLGRESVFGWHDPRGGVWLVAKHCPKVQSTSLERRIFGRFWSKWSAV